MLNQAGVMPAIKEMLMGHKNGLESSYLRPSDNELISEYLKGADLLTVYEEKQLKNEVEKLRIENAEIEIIKRSYLGMEMALEVKDEQIRMICQTLYGIMSKVPLLLEEIPKKRFGSM